MATYCDLDYFDSSRDLLSPGSKEKKKLSRGRQCVAYGCQNYQYSVTDGNRLKSSRRFFCFPKDKTVRAEWCRLIKREDGRDGFNVTGSTRVCDAHFPPTDFINGKQAPS